MTQTDLSDPLIRIESEEFIAWATVKSVNFGTMRVYFLGSGDRGILFTDEITQDMLTELGWPNTHKAGLYINPAAISHVSPAKGTTNVVRIDFKDGGHILDQSMQITTEMYANIVERWREYLKTQQAA